MTYRFQTELVLSRDLLGPHATTEPAQAPVLSCKHDEVTVALRKKNRFVFGIPGRTFDDLPGHVGALGRYWTWVAHPDQDQMLAFIPQRPPTAASYHEGRLRLYRLYFRPMRGDIANPLRITAPCIIVAGLGGIEMAGDHGSTQLTKPEPLAKFDLDKMRNHVHTIPNSKTRLQLPCALPNSVGWLTDEKQAIARLTATLQMAYKRDPPDWFLLPCYLSDSTPGLILARRKSDEWTFVSTDLELRDVDATPNVRNEYHNAECVRPTPNERRSEKSTPMQWDPPPPFTHGDYTIHFENNAILVAACEKVLNGAEYKVDDERRHRPASAGAWRRAACVYALQIRRVAVRDLRECGWAESMARCIETFADDIGTDTHQWFQKKDGPHAFARLFTVHKNGNLASNATEAIAALLDALVRPHGRVRIGG